MSEKYHQMMNMEFCVCSLCFDLKCYFFWFYIHFIIIFCIFIIHFVRIWIDGIFCCSCIFCLLSAGRLGLILASIWSFLPFAGKRIYRICVISKLTYFLALCVQFRNVGIGTEARTVERTNTQNHRTNKDETRWRSESRRQTTTTSKTPPLSFLTVQHHETQIIFEAINYGHFYLNIIFSSGNAIHCDLQHCHIQTCHTVRSTRRSVKTRETELQGSITWFSL